LRLAVDELCDVETDDGRHLDATVCNLSLTGAYLAMSPVPEIGRTLHVTFCLPGATTPIACDAMVAWQNRPSAIFTELGGATTGLPPGCGVRFIGVSPNDEQSLRACGGALFDEAVE
jgi:hypothetical protein